MPAIETCIWLALKSRIDTLTTSPVMTKVEPGQVYEPYGVPFIQVSDARNDVDRGGRIDTDLQVHSGTLILQVRWPIQTPVSHTQLTEIGGNIAAHFPADLCMSYGGKTIRVQDDASAMQPDTDGAYRVVTVRVLWATM